MQIQERRTSSRVPAHFSVQYFYRAPNTVSPATRTINATVNGARVEALDPLPQGAAIAFLLLTDDREVLDVRGQVVYVEPMAERQGVPYHAGVRFTKLAEKDRAVLLRALERVPRS